MSDELYSWVCENDLCWIGFFFQSIGFSSAEMTQEMFMDFNFDLETALLYKD